MNTIEYAIIVKNKTRLESLIERFNTKAQAEFYIKSLGGNFEDYEREHEQFHQSLISLQTQLSRIVKNKTVERHYLPSFIFAPQHLVVVIGQDGLVANTAKYSKSCPIIAVNPDKQRYDGVLLPFDTSNFTVAVENVMNQKYHAKTMAFAEAKLNDGQRILAFNDLFIGASSHISARYKISFGKATEEHSSSGLIVSTPAGATGWLSSIFNMVEGIIGDSSKQGDLNKKGGSSKKMAKRQRISLKNDELFFAVREPFKSIRTQVGLTAGRIGQSRPLIIESLMPAKGVIFSDGIESDFLSFNSGSIATIGVAPETAQLVINKSLKSK